MESVKNPEPLYEVNEPGVVFWERLVLEGNQLAATCGMDLHGKWSFADQYATFIEGAPNGDIESELADAIHSCRTWVSKGPLLLASYDANDNCLHFTVERSSKSGFTYPASKSSLSLNHFIDFFYIESHFFDIIAPFDPAVREHSFGNTSCPQCNNRLFLFQTHTA